MTPTNQPVQAAQAQPQQKPKNKTGLMIRYGVAGVLVVALIVLTGLLLQSRAEAKNKAQDSTPSAQSSTSQWVYAQGATQTGAQTATQPETQTESQPVAQTPAEAKTPA